MSLTSAEVIRHLQLVPHPEGGFYRRSYESDIPLSLDLTPHSQFKIAPRPCATAIYFLLPYNAVSCLHVIPSDELWHFYLGDSLTVIEFDLSAGTVTRTVLGVNLLAGECVQHAVRAGRVFGALATAELARIDALDALDARASHLDTVSNAAPPPCTSQALTTLCAMSVMSHADLAPAATDADTDASSAPAACAANHVLPARLTSGVDGAGYSLVGCVVAPGFEFGDFALVSRADLEAAFAPAWHRLIRRLTLS